MYLALELPVAVVVDRELELVGKLHTRPEGDFQSRGQLPQGLIHLVDDQVLQRDLRIYQDVGLADGRGYPGLRPDLVPAVVQPARSAPCPAPGVKGHGDFRHPYVQSYYLYDPAVVAEYVPYQGAGHGEAFGRYLIGVALEGKHHPLRRLARPYVGEAPLLEAPDYRSQHTVIGADGHAPAPCPHGKRRKQQQGQHGNLHYLRHHESISIKTSDVSRTISLS